MAHVRAARHATAPPKTGTSRSSPQPRAKSRCSGRKLAKRAYFVDEGMLRLSCRFFLVGREVCTGTSPSRQAGTAPGRARGPGRSSVNVPQRPDWSAIICPGYPARPGAAARPAGYSVGRGPVGIMLVDVRDGGTHRRRLTRVGSSRKTPRRPASRLAIDQNRECWLREELADTPIKTGRAEAFQLGSPRLGYRIRLGGSISVEGHRVAQRFQPGSPGPQLQLATPAEKRRGGPGPHHRPTKPWTDRRTWVVQRQVPLTTLFPIGNGRPKRGVKTVEQGDRPRRGRSKWGPSPQT